ncbi:MAG: type III-A CRISPR-associated RAMP protein Csm4 [Saprospiraceae bacterium]
MQQQFTAIRLNIHHSIHIGSHREEYERSDSILHSDSLYSAIIAAWAVLGVEHSVFDLPGNAVPRDLDLGFAITSLFPFFREKADDKPLYFFPIPMRLKSENPRRYREVEWLSTGVFKHYLSTGQVKEAETKGAFLSPAKGFDPDKFMQREAQPRAYVPRAGEKDANGQEITETVIYYIDRLFFSEHSGLFGLATFDNDDIRAKVMLALDYLQYAGIGTDRNVGHGQFQCEVEGFDRFDDLPDSDHALNLSMFLPESKSQLADMLNSDQCCHDIVKRGGWITTDGLLSYRKDSVYMFREGGVFKTKQPVAGGTVNLRPVAVLGHGDPVLRVGRSVFLPCIRNFTT